MKPCIHKALFLDRDGTIIHNKNYLFHPDGVELLPGAARALHEALSRGYRLFLFTNQSGVGRGWYAMEDVYACHRRMFELLALPEPGFTEICIAPEAPDQPQVYRKPSPRFIIEMVGKYALDPTQSFMVGDSRSDLEAGLKANITPILVKTGKEISEELREWVWQEQIPLYKNLLEFVKSLL